MSQKEESIQLEERSFEREVKKESKGKEEFKENQEKNEEEVEETLEEKIERKYKQLEREMLMKELLVESDDGFINKKIGDLINPELHLWMSKDTFKPIVNEDGFRILTEATGVEFSQPKIIEKQSDFNNFNGQQVWIEIEAKFPSTGEVNVDYGIANHKNSPGAIAKNHLPIMALKRAKERAFYRSKTMNLFVYSDTEMSDSFTQEIKNLRNDLNLQKKSNETLLNKYKEIKAELDNSRSKAKMLLKRAIESSVVNGVKVWSITDPVILKEIIENKETSSIDRYVASFRLEMISKKDD